MREQIDKKTIDEAVSKAYAAGIFEKNAVYTVFYELKSLVHNNYPSFTNCGTLADELFIRYLKVKSNDSSLHYLEGTLILLAPLLSDKVFEFILSHNLDMSYTDLDIPYSDDQFDMVGVPMSVADVLAFYVINPSIMRMVLKQIIPTGKDRFYDEGTEEHTDLGEMYVKADMLDEAYDFYISDRFCQIFGMDENDFSLFRSAKHGYYLDENFNRLFVSMEDQNCDDRMFSLIRTIMNSKIALSRKRAILNKILFSGRYKLFNILGLKYIKKILNSDEYLRFLDYLISEVRTKNIILYKVDTWYDWCHNGLNIMYQVPLETFEKETNGKNICFNPKKNVQSN